jgi:hypothetical protein
MCLLGGMLESQHSELEADAKRPAVLTLTILVAIFLDSKQYGKH